jgi:hypothetical protein
MVKELFVGCGRPRGRSIIRFCLRKVKSGGTGSSDRVLLDATECRASSQFYVVLGESSQLISCLSASLSTFLMRLSRAGLKHSSYRWVDWEPYTVISLALYVYEVLIRSHLFSSVTLVCLHCFSFPGDKTLQQWAFKSVRYCERRSKFHFWAMSLEC